MSVRHSVDTLIGLVEQGQILEAFDRFYAEDVLMAENLNPPTLGKAANRTREENFVGSVAEVHENRAAFSAVDGDRAVINWVLDFTNTQGQRIAFNQLAVQTWKDGKIVEERFVYDPTTLIQ